MGRDLWGRVGDRDGREKEKVGVIIYISLAILLYITLSDPHRDETVSKECMPGMTELYSLHQLAAM